MNVKPPTTMELATIAATLAKNGSIDAKRLAKDALQIWAHCDDLITQAKQGLLADEPETPLQPQFEYPKTFPVELPDALILWFPGVKEPDRWKYYRDWLDYYNKTESETARILKATAPPARSIEAEKARLLGKSSFECDGWAIQAWRKMQTSAARSASGRMGGQAKSSRKKKITKGKGEKKNP